MDYFTEYGTTKAEILSTLFELLQEEREAHGFTTKAERIAYTIGIIDKLDD